MPMVGTRSEQQQGVYDAESTTALGRTFASIEDAQVFVDSITASDWWTDCYPDVVRVDVTKQRENSPCIGTVEGTVGIIALNSYGLCERVIIHEVAHTVEPKAGHTGPWVRANLNITYRVRGSDAYMDLYNAYTAEGVDLG